MANDPKTTFEGFSVSHAAILDGATGAEEVDGDIYGVRTGSLSANTGNYDNTGDDFVLSSWFWIEYGTLTIEAGYVPFKTIALLSNEEVTSSVGGGGAASYSIPLWSEQSVNVPPKPVLVRVPSKDADGAIHNLDFVLYRVQFAPFNFTGPAYKSGLLLSYTGRAVLSAKDEKGQQVLDKNGEPTRAIGRLVAHTVV